MAGLIASAVVLGSAAKSGPSHTISSVRSGAEGVTAGTRLGAYELVPFAAAMRGGDTRRTAASGSTSVTRPRCPSARGAVAFYSSRVTYWLGRMGAGQSARARTDTSGQVRPYPCPRYLAHVLQRKAYALRRVFERWWLRVTTDPDEAIEYVFGPYAWQAKNVAACESGDRDGDLSPHVVRAHNGQYLGMFQMGSYARSLYGHSQQVLRQVVAAYRYFVASGRDWSPWSCKP